jgi:predicted RNA-binding protein Jag
MTSVEKTARTAEEAIQLALDELGLPRDQVQVEILEESRSLFGILGPDAHRPADESWDAIRDAAWESPDPDRRDP